MLEIVINGETVITFDKKRLPGHQRQFLDAMDLDMDEGIELAGEYIAEPDELQRAKYVAMSLFMAINSENADMANAMCAYLVYRQPELKQVRVIENGMDIELDLLYTEIN